MSIAAIVAAIVVVFVLGNVFVIVLCTAAKRGSELTDMIESNRERKLTLPEDKTDAYYMKNPTNV